MLMATKSLRLDYLSKDVPTAQPRPGRFGDYQRANNRLIPMRADGAWSLDTGESVYWRGPIFEWHQQPISRNSRTTIAG